MPVETAGIFIFDTHQNFLVCHPTGHHGASWSIPKGIPDKGEPYKVATVRELEEETNITLTEDQIERVAFIGDFKYPNKDKVLYAFVLFLDDDPIPTDLKCMSMFSMKYGKFPEVDGYFWMNIDQSIFVNCAQKEALTHIINSYKLKTTSKNWLGGDINTI